MKRTASVVILLLLAISLTGCDFLRHVAGRPDSKELARRQDAVEQVRRLEEARVQAVKDSLAAVERYHADSLSAIAFLKDNKVPVIPASSVKGLKYKQFGDRYCVMLGVFSQKENASALESKLQKAGYGSVTMMFTSGKYLVGACSGNDFVKIRNDYERLRAERFCPKEAWIFVNDSL